MTYQQAVIEIARFVQALEWAFVATGIAWAFFILLGLASWLRERVERRRAIKRRTYTVRTAAGPVRVWNREQS